MNRVYVPTKAEIIIYAGGKTWMSDPFRSMRDTHGFNVNSSWIDLPHALTGPDDSYTPESHADTKFLGEIWDEGCKLDCFNADLMILATAPQDQNMLSGALVELGHVSAAPENRPVYILGTSASVEPAGNSDRAWKYQANVHFWPEYLNKKDRLDLLEGFTAVVRHYRANYAPQWNERRAGATMEGHTIPKYAEGG